jgi:hypothetical protein
MTVFCLAALIPALGSIPGSGVFPAPGSSSLKTTGLVLLRYVMGLFLVMMPHIKPTSRLHQREFHWSKPQSMINHKYLNINYLKP